LQPAASVAADTLLPYAHRHHPSFFGRIVSDDMWGRGTLLCRDLTGDGHAEMIVRLVCCTGGSPSPWAIFEHDRAGDWRMRYARDIETVFRLGVRGRDVRAMMPAPYEGACTRWVRFRVVRWDGSRFRSRITHRRYLGNPCHLRR
jgi:hypothetical protein